MEMNIKITQAAYHRNGICGAPFYAILFDDLEEKRKMMATLFEKRGYCAVYDVALLAEGCVEFGVNSWRGDNYAHELRPLLVAWLKANDQIPAFE